jgi:hypothetical protein
VALLEKAGLTVRLANAALDPDASAKLAGSWRARARPALPEPVVDDPAFFEQLITELGVDAAAFRAGYLAYETARAGVVAKATARIAAQVTALGALVPAPADVPAPDSAQDAAALADHWWVQVGGEDGSWTDLDPSLPDAVPGQALAAATETLAAADLADDRRHTLTVRVIGEVWHDQVREETTLLEHTFAPALFFGQRIVVTTIPIDMPPFEELLKDPHPGTAVRVALSSQTEWAPALQIGPNIVVQKTVTDGGEVFDLAEGNTNRLARIVSRATEKGVGGATDLLGGLPDDPSGMAAPAKPSMAASSGFTAQWIEYELRAPGEPARVARRVVFDALDVADRSTAKPIKLTEPAQFDRALGLISQAELLPMFAAIPEAFVNDRTAKALEDDRAALVDIAGLGTQAPTKEQLDRINAITPLPARVYDLALARFAWSSFGTQVYLDRLNLLVESRQLVADGASVRARVGFDIAANAVTAWPGSKTAPRTVRMTQGIVDTVAEAVTVSCPAGSKRCVRGVNTSDAFATSTGPWTVVATADAPQLARMSPAARQLAAADLAGGYVLVLPPGDHGTVTWWRVDPASGESLGMGTLGGNLSAETVAILNWVLIGGGGLISSTLCLAGYGMGGMTALQLALCGAAMGSGVAGGIFALEMTKNGFLAVAAMIIGGAFAGAAMIVPGPE